MNPPAPDAAKILDEILRLPTPDLLGYMPYQRKEADALLRRAEFPVDDVRCELGLPVPPDSLRVSPDYGRTIADYLRIGKEHVATMKSLLARTGFTLADGARVLDFGSSAGRMTRWLRPDADRCLVVGADISAEAVFWSREKLGAPFAFLTTTLQPHLPFRDRTFDLIYSGSVFTHIDDLADAWLAELARILKPGGRAYLTIHDEAAMRQLDGPYAESHFSQWLAKRPGYANHRATDYAMFTINRGSRSQVFYAREYFRAMAAPWFEIQAFDEGAYLYQTAVTLAAR